MPAEKATENSLLFEMLSKPARVAIFNSMTLVTVSAGTEIITQGDAVATKFFILDRGTCDVLLTKPAWGPEPRKVLTYAPGRSGPISNTALGSGLPME